MRHVASTDARGTLAVCAVASVVCVAVDARGDTTVHATGEASVSYNDNIQGAPDEPPEGVPPAVEDVSVTVSPGLLLVFNRPRYQVTLGYGRSLIFFLQNPEADASADQVDLAANIAASRVDDVSVGLSVTRASTNLSTLGAPQDTTTQAQPLGSFQMLRGTFGEQWQHGLSPTTFLEQTAGATLTLPLSDDATEAGTVTGDVAMGPTWLIGDHVVGGTAGVQYLRGLERTLADGTVTPRFDQITPRAAVRWRFQFARWWASQASVGIAVPFDPERDFVATPLASAGVYYTQDDYFASLVYDRNVATNLLSGQAFHSDTVALSGAVPIWVRGGLFAAGSAGIANNRLVDASLDGDSIDVNNFVLDAGVRWAPPRLPISVGLRYQRLQQFGAPEDQTRLFDFSRNVASLTLGWFFPSRDRASAVTTPVQ